LISVGQGFAVRTVKSWLSRQSHAPRKCLGFKDPFQAILKERLGQRRGEDDVLISSWDTLWMLI
jgi:hypothetical protein